MADVIHRTDRDASGALLQLYSVNTPDYSVVNWIINPDLSALGSVPKYYWKTVGDTVVEMTQGEKDVVDASRLSAAKTLRKQRLQDEADVYVKGRYPNSADVTLDAIYTEAVRDRPNRADYVRPWIEWRRQVADEIKTKQDAADAASTVAAVEAIELDTATLDSADPAITINGAMAETDTAALSSFLNTNALVVDPVTGVQGPFLSMQVLMNRREIFNDVDNPLYDADQVPLIGSGGSVTNLNDIHAKLGWHRQEVFKQGWRRPRDLLIYYGWPSAFNSLGSNEAVAQAMARYELVILGNGLDDPSHGDYANTTAIIARIKILNPSTLIFGYVSTNQVLADFQTKVGRWNTLGVHGIFMDESGYDYGKTRAEFNTRVDYVHGQTVANLCFANAWNTDHVLGTTNDASYPNSTYNPTPVESNLTEDDWILLESLAVNTTAYSGNDGYASKSDWSVRIGKMITLRATYGVNFASVGIVNNGNGAGQDLFDFSFVSALMGPVEAHGTSDTSYGASSSAVTFWDRPETHDLDELWSVNASVQVDAADADVYHRYTGNLRLSLDFSASAQSATISPDTPAPPAGLIGLGGWDATKSFATDYQAATDGLVMAGINSGLGVNQNVSMQGKTDASSTPTTVRACCQADQKATLLYASMTMPVKKDDYWRVDRSGTEGTQFLFWIPLA